MKTLSSILLTALLVCAQSAIAQTQSGVLLKTFALKAEHLLVDPARPRLYATVPAENSIAVIDTETNALKAKFFIGSDPSGLSISADGKRLYVANQGSTSAGIGVVDLTTLKVLPSLPAPFKSVDIASGLSDRLYLVSGSGDGIAQISASTGVLQDTFAKDVAFYDGLLQISPDRKTLYFADHGLSPSSLARYNVSTATAALLQENEFGNLGSNGESLTISHNGDFLVFPNGGGNGPGYSTTLIPADDVNGVLGTFNVDAYPGTAAFSPDDSLLYEVQSSANVVKVFSTRTFTQLDSFAIPTEDSGYGPEVTGLAISGPNSYAYTAVTDGSSNNRAGDLLLVSTGHTPFFDGSVALSGGYAYLQFTNGVIFGYYNFNFLPYLFHDDLGFLYPIDAADGSGGIYLYDFTSETFWFTSPTLFPYLYDFTLNTFLYYYPDTQRAGHYTTNPRYFFNFNSGQIITK